MTGQVSSGVERAADGDALRERYGAPAPWRRRSLVAASAVVVLLFAGWLAWTIADQTTPAVTSELETRSIDGQHEVTAVVVVRLASSDVRASCRLRAYSEDHNVVGEHTFTPDPAAGRRQVQQFRTERRATTVESLGCTAPGQPRPR